MTYIVSFEIEGLAGRPGKLQKSLHRKTNIFWGLNGSGKTTLLKILAAALRNDASELQSLPFQSATVRFHSERMNRDVVRSYSKRSVKRVARRSKSIQRNRLQQEMLLSDEWAVEDPDDSIDNGSWTTIILGEPLEESETFATRFAHSFLPIARIVAPDRDRGQTWVDLTPDERFVRQVNSVWSRYNSYSLAEIRDVQQFGLAEILAILFGGRSSTAFSIDAPSEPLSLSDPEIDSKQAWQLVSNFLRAQNLYLPLGRKDFVQRYDEREENRRVVSRIEEIARQVDEILAPQRELQSVIEDMYIGDKHLELKGTAQRPVGAIEVQVGSEAIPLTSLSSGERQLLHILLETLAVRESTIMVDEPELSLHVEWQTRLVHSMRRINADAQFLLATHSPELMVDVDPDCVFEL